MAIACKKLECTVSQTGICLLNHDVNSCPERLKDDEGSIETHTESTIPAPLVAPERNPRFPSSFALTPDALRELSGKQMCQLIGVLGAPDAGKTAIMVSLYLLLSAHKLEGYSFADSATLRAFDEISRGARRFIQGQIPEQMTNHTEETDQRTAGFLHLSLRDKTTRERINFLMPDLPGEWSTSLIDSNRVDRLDFLRSAEVIWVTVDGRQLIGTNTRQQVLHRTGKMLQRIAEFLGTAAPPIIVVISHRDLGDPSDASLRKIEQEAERLNLRMSVMQVSSFSDNDTMEPGTGIAELIKASLVRMTPETDEPLWPDSTDSDSFRQMLNFRARGVHS